MESSESGKGILEKIFLVLLIIFCPFLILGLFLESVLVIIGLVLAVAGIAGYRTPRKAPKPGETWMGNFKAAFDDKRFLILIIFALGWFIVFLFNSLTIPPTGPLLYIAGPLYYIREAELMRINPGIPVEELPMKSTFGIVPFLMDTGILIIFAYILYIRFKPGEQELEDAVNEALSRTWFTGILLVSALYHVIGHLPLELYGRGQWGTGYETLIAWFGYDKFAHAMTSCAMTMLIAALVTKYFLNREIMKSKKDVLIVFGIAIAIMMTIGVIWEFVEWFANVGHFVDEILDTPKDLAWDFAGSIVGAILGFLDLKKEIGKQLKKTTIK
ncbi:MAG: hypothetical protein ACFFD4_37270 [Candidatus Odinarchaeota archaeon]